MSRRLLETQNCFKQFQICDIEKIWVAWTHFDFMIFYVYTYIDMICIWVLWLLQYWHGLFVTWKSFQPPSCLEKPWTFCLVDRSGSPRWRVWSLKGNPCFWAAAALEGQPPSWAGKRETWHIFKNGVEDNKRARNEICTCLWVIWIFSVLRIA